MTIFDQPYAERQGSQFETYENVAVEYRDASHAYWLHYGDTRERVVSVTSALRVLDKAPLLPWAEAAGCEGGVKLERMGELEGVPPEEAINVVRLHKLGMDAKRDAGADRGTAVHTVLELWAREERIPNLSDFPAEVRGYVQGLCAWLLKAGPKPSSVERFVGSLKYRYAGRMDMRAHIHGFDCIVDLKTSPAGRVYPEAHAQAMAYSIADVECGNPRPDGIIIVGVGADGSFTQVECEATAEDWLAILACHRTMGRLRSSIKVAEKAA